MKRGKASLAGFEPATRCLEGSRSVPLSYRDAQKRRLNCTNAAEPRSRMGQPVVPRPSFASLRLCVKIANARLRGALMIHANPHDR